MKKILISVTLLSMSVAAYAENGAATRADTGLQSLENISAELVKVRQQIESLHTEINFEKNKYKDEMRSFASQKSDLEVRISRADLNIKDLQRELEKLADENRKKTQAQADVTPIVKSAIKALRESVSTSLPFKLQQRLNALDEIENRLDTHVITSNKAANQLWAFVEDELMLGKSSGLYNDTITIDGKEKLVKVLRIGKVAMFFRSSEGEYGVIKQQKGSWEQAVLDDSDSINQLDTLFDSFNKNIRNGQFVVPNFLPKS